jgi:ligand-binding sensor domain-containing protein
MAALILLLAAQPAQSEWQTFRAREGLTNDNVYSVFQDRAGSLWFSTYEGLTQYNGHSWGYFPFVPTGWNSILEDRSGNLWLWDNTTSGNHARGVLRFDGSTVQPFTEGSGLTSDYVRSVAEDRNGNLWFSYGAGGNGVTRFDGSTWRPFTDADVMPYREVVSMLADREGNMWFTFGRDRVTRFDGSNWQTFPAEEGLWFYEVGGILEDRQGNIWFGSGEGLARFDGSNWQTFVAPGGVAGGFVTTMLEDTGGNIWMACEGGGPVTRFDGRDWRGFREVDGLSSTYVTKVVEDHSGNLWFLSCCPGLDRGVTRYDGRGFRTFTATDGLSSSNVINLLVDRPGNLWFGTTSGATRFDGSQWRAFTVSDSLRTNYVEQILEARAGSIWFNYGSSAVGLTRFDGSRFQHLAVGDSLANTPLSSMLEDRAGNLWIGSHDRASRYDGTRWQSYDLGDSLSTSLLFPLLEDRIGNIWFGGGRSVRRFDGTNWQTFPLADSLGNTISTMVEDHAGTLWAGTPRGLWRFDGMSWSPFASFGQMADGIRALLVDRAGILWVATYRAVSRYDGMTWQTFPVGDMSCTLGSLLEDHAGSIWAVCYGNRPWRYDGASWQPIDLGGVYHIWEDRAGNLWFAGSEGVTRYDGLRSRVFTADDGLVGNRVEFMLSDRNGNLWFSTDAGVSHFEPDHVPPQPVALTAIPAVSPLRDQSAAFIASFGENGVEFSYRLVDTSRHTEVNPWSSWTRVSSWTAPNLSDAKYRLDVRARDLVSNVDSIAVGFELDATPPGPVLSAPAFGQSVRGNIEVRGLATDARFRDYRVEIRPAGAASWDPPTVTSLSQSHTPVAGGRLATWDTATLPDGLYDLRLSVSDTLGLTGSVQVTVIVDNHAPFADQTTPAKVAAATGGDIYTTNGEVHLYFPPHAFAEDAVVTIDPVAPDDVPATLPSGAQRVLSGHQLSWNGEVLRKPARLELSFADVTPPSADAVALYLSTDGTSWRHLGGTVTAESRRITLEVSEPGRYALFAGGTVSEGDPTLSTISFSPRVFSPTGGFADREVGIGFTLGQGGSVTVRVYNRAGWLVREVAHGVTMGPGANLVRWDGRDRAGEVVADGLYLVAVEALGRTQTRTLAVVR